MWMELKGSPPKPLNTTFDNNSALTINNTSRVLLIDGNPRSPKLHEMFGVKSSPGFTDYLFSDMSSSEVNQKTAYNNLNIITFGTTPSTRSNIFSDSAHVDKLKAIAEEYDYVIFDGNSIMGSSDSSIMAPFFDGVVIVVECEKTRYQIVQPVIEKIQKVGGNILGVVLNKRKYYIPRMLHGKI